MKISNKVGISLRTLRFLASSASEKRRRERWVSAELAKRRSES